MKLDRLDHFVLTTSHFAECLHFTGMSWAWRCGSNRAVTPCSSARPRRLRNQHPPRAGRIPSGSGPSCQWQSRPVFPGGRGCGGNPAGAGSGRLACGRRPHGATRRGGNPGQPLRARSRRKPRGNRGGPAGRVNPSPCQGSSPHMRVAFCLRFRCFPYSYRCRREWNKDRERGILKIIKNYHFAACQQAEYDVKDGGI